MTTTDTPRRPRRRGRRFILALILLALLAVFFRWQQDGIRTQSVEVDLPGLPAAFDGLRIVQLSDLHGKEFGADSARLLEAVAGLSPDLIALTGDFVDQEAQLGMLPALADGLAAIAPAYYVTGNHEWAIHRVNDIKALLTEHGVHVLTNDYEVWEKDGATLAVAGIDDPNGPADQKTGDVLRSEIDADCVILLAHRNTVEEYAAWGYDLVLCGHGHGGLFRIPVLDIGLLDTNRQLFPRYDSGLYPMGEGAFCFVSRGLGSNTVPFHAFRLFNRPDLPVLVLRAQG